MVGHTRNEQRLLSALTGELGQITQSRADEAARVFGPDPARYRAAFPDAQELYEVVRSDWLFRMPFMFILTGPERISRLENIMTVHMKTV